MKQHIFTLTFTTEGSAKKVFQFKMPLKSVHKKSFCFDEEKCMFEQFRMVKTIKKSL
jgi:hypothetical protein